MKKQALSFFFFVMLNLALAREGNINAYRFSAGIESDLSKNKINYRKKNEEDTLLIGEFSVARPVESAEHTLTGDHSEWYTIRTNYRDDSKTGYVWNIPFRLINAEPGNRHTAAEFMCYGINSFDLQKGMHSAARIIQNGRFIAGKLQHFSFDKIAATETLRQSMFIKTAEDHHLPGIKKVISLEFGCKYPGAGNEEIVLLWKENKIWAAAKLQTFTCEFSGIPVKFSLN